jgi:RecA-family ATPase
LAWQVINKQQQRKETVMTKTEVVIRWLAEDIQQLRPDWSLDKCEAVLEKVGRALTDRSIEVGWEILEVLLSIEDSEVRV